MRSQQLLSFLVCLMTLIGAFAAAPTTAPSPPTVDVSIDNFAFGPATLTIAPGTRVRWTNRDDVPHTVTSTDKRFTGSKTLDTDDTFTAVFNEPGSYPYYCAVHPHMTATIVVK